MATNRKKNWKEAIVEAAQEVIDTFTQFKPEVIGFTTVSSQWSFAVELAGMVKEINPKAAFSIKLGRKINFLIFFKLLHLIIIHNLG